MPFRQSSYLIHSLVVMGIITASVKVVCATNTVMPVSSAISTSLTDVNGNKCSYTVNGSWLNPDQTWDSPYRHCVSAVYDQYTNPNDPNSKLSCRITVSIATNTSTAYNNQIEAESYIAYPYNGSQVQILDVDHVFYAGNQPGFVKTSYKAHGDFRGYYFANGPQYKVKSNGVVKASSSIW